MFTKIKIIRRLYENDFTCLDGMFLCGDVGFGEQPCQCARVSEQSHYDYFIFGHRHIPLNIDLGSNSRYINLGEWIHSNTYACFDGKELSLLTFNENEKA